MYSSLQRLNHLASISTTFVMVLLGLISAASFFTQPTVEGGKLDVHDLIVRRGRIQRWGARDEDIAQLRFDIKTDLTPLLTSYNTKQLFIYLVASYDENEPNSSPNATAVGHHEVVLWDRILTRADHRDFRAVGKHEPPKKSKGKSARRRRGNVRVEDARSTYIWRNPDRSFKNIRNANISLHYSLMPYVGMVTTGIAATAEGPIEIPAVKQRS